MTLQVHLGRRPRLIGTLLATVALIHAPSAGATLGGHASSVAADAKAFSAHVENLVQSASPAYTVQTITEEGCSVREYIDKSGTVFAVAWKGAHHPDLTQLLGNYFNEYQTAAAQVHSHKQGGRKVVTVQSARSVVEMGGHMRAVQGRAYIPSMLPAGVTVDEIHY